MNTLIGFSKHADGTLLLIGAGPEEWLRRRMHAGATALVTRQPYPGELDHEPSPERDLSGGSLR